MVEKARTLVQVLCVNQLKYSIPGIIREADKAEGLTFKLGDFLLAEIFTVSDKQFIIGCKDVSKYGIIDQKKLIKEMQDEMNQVTNKKSQQ